MTPHVGMMIVDRAEDGWAIVTGIEPHFAGLRVTWYNCSDVVVTTFWYDDTEKDYEKVYYIIPKE